MTENAKNRILNVDDNEALRYVVTKILTHAGFEVIEAANGRDAVRLAGEQPDLVVLDVNLPDLNGFEVCRRLKADPSTRHIPVLHLSATRVQSSDRVEGLEGGADGYLVHPVDPRELTATVRALLRLKQAEEQLRESEAHFRLLAENAQDIICHYELKPRRHFAYVSPAATRILGYTPEEHYADPDLRLKIVHPEDRPLLDQLLGGAAPADKPLELRWIHKNGATVWTELRCTLVFDPSGELVAMETITRDISERKRVEAEREKLIADLQQALANVKTLSGLLPICSGCKKIRNDQGYWSQVDTYIEGHSEATFTHGLCPKCITKYYPDLTGKIPKNTDEKTDE